MSFKIDGKAVSRAIIESAKRFALGDAQLNIIMVGNDYASKLYTTKKRELARSIGMDANVINLESDINKEELIKQVKDYATRGTGIMVQLPLPDRSIENEVIDAIRPSKDVDGLTGYNIGAIFMQDWDRCHYISCTALSSLAMISTYLQDLKNVKGMKVALIGFTRVVNIPLAAVLSMMGATIYVAHKDTKLDDFNDICYKADMVISSVGKHGIIKSENLSDNTILVDVGITHKDNKVVGDLTQDNCEKSIAYTPVPGGVGIVTLSTLMLNTAISSERNTRSFDVYQELIFKNIT